jgi:hypothetical protein
MIRRDYILRMIEEMGAALAQIRALRRSGRADAARRMVDAECEKLAAMGVVGIVALSETDCWRAFRRASLRTRCICGHWRW